MLLVLGLLGTDGGFTRLLPFVDTVVGNIIPAPLPPPELAKVIDAAAATARDSDDDNDPLSGWIRDQVLFTWARASSALPPVWGENGDAGRCETKPPLGVRDGGGV